MLSRFFKQHLYVQLAPDRLVVRDPDTKSQFAEPPEVAIQHAHGKKATILGIGSDARAHIAAPDTSIHNPLGHPRSLVSDFTVAEQLVKAAFRRVRGARLLQPAPVVVMHPLGEHAGGLTQVELRAFHELALGAGASKVFIWQGPQLTDEQVRSEQFPQGGRLLLQ